MVLIFFSKKTFTLYLCFYHKTTTMKIHHLAWLFALSILVTTCRPKSDDTPVVDPEWEISFTLNPAGVNPLCAKLEVEANIEGKVKIEVFGQDGEVSDITHIFSEIAASQSVPVLGLYPDYENVVKVSFLDAEDNELLQKELTISTEALPENHPNITIITASPEQMEPGLTLISNRSNQGPNRPYMIDAFGKVRWVLDYTDHPVLGNLYYDVGIERLQNGNFYFGEAGNDAIYEVDIYGDIVNEWVLPNFGFHHNVQEKPDGNFLLTANHYSTYHENGNQTNKDYVIEIDRETGALVMEWDLKESLDEWRTVLGSTLGQNPMDWAHGNAVIYDESDNTIIVSAQRQGVVKLNYDNDVVWVLAPHRDWGTNRKGVDLNEFLLNPLDVNGSLIEGDDIAEGSGVHSDFEWNWYQHAPMLLPNGHLMLFDNGSNRNFGGSPNYSRAVEYDIDEEAMTVRQVWQYGKERGLETYSFLVSDVDYLPKKNNVLFAPGYCNANADVRGGRVVEVNYDTKEVVFEAFFNGGILDLQFHRAERLSIYPDI